MSNLLFKNYFEYEPTHMSSAHGRVNLIGEHVDYNGGLVMPCQLNHQISIWMARREDRCINGLSDKFGPMDRDITAPLDGSWLDFVSGALHMIAETGTPVTGLDLLVSGNVPAGAGVSSSAALEIALLRGMVDLFGARTITAVDMAKLAQRIEHEFIGTQCGIMDQMVSAAAAPGRAMLLDCQTLEFTLNPLFADASFVVMHSGSSRKLSDGLFNTRLAECKQAATRLGVDNLGVADAGQLAQLDDAVLVQRARHVISEIARVRSAADRLQAQDPAGFGAVMNASHASLRDDYAVSSSALDELVAAFCEHGAYGARLTGAGFGGCVVALCPHDQVTDIITRVLEACPDAYMVDVVCQA